MMLTTPLRLQAATTLPRFTTSLAIPSSTRLVVGKVATSTSLSSSSSSSWTFHRHLSLSPTATWLVKQSLDEKELQRQHQRHRKKPTLPNRNNNSSSSTNSTQQKNDGDRFDVREMGRAYSALYDDMVQYRNHHDAHGLLQYSSTHSRYHRRGDSLIITETLSLFASMKGKHNRYDDDQWHLLMNDIMATSLTGRDACESLLHLSYLQLPSSSVVEIECDVVSHLMKCIMNETKFISALACAKALSALTNLYNRRSRVINGIRERQNIPLQTVVRHVLDRIMLVIDRCDSPQVSYIILLTGVRLRYNECQRWEIGIRRCSRVVKSTNTVK
jgi:hypothetical protein